MTTIRKESISSNSMANMEKAITHIIRMKSTMLLIIHITMVITNSTDTMIKIITTCTMMIKTTTCTTMMITITTTTATTIIKEA